ncbi:FHA domain-containing protein FhaB [Planctomycetaceae bacterium]|nr:FHA domain-containing protein FhaB [Planctomycetaceae bacterium]
MNQLVYTFEGQTTKVPLVDKPVSFGRGDAADHRLPDKSSSRVHAQFLFREGRWCVEDLQSANGTLLNGKKISGIVALNPGDVVKVGATEMKFEGEAPKPPPEPESQLPRLVYQPDPNVAPIVVLIRDRITVGRKADNSLQIDNKGVSGVHVEVVRKGGACLLRDLDSSNGTTVGGKEVRECGLHNGDNVVLGKVAKLFFIDPLGQTAPAESAKPVDVAKAQTGAPSPVSMAAPAVAPASSAAGASDRGTFQPVAEPDDNLAGAWGLNVVIALLISGALLAGGYAVAGYLTKPAEQESKAPVMAALDDSALSFEGEVDARGNPAGWTARFEAPQGGKVELTSDGDNPGDGARSLAIKQTQTGGAGLLILSAEKPRDYELSGVVQFSLMARGEGVSSACIACALDSKGVQQTLVTMPLKGLGSKDWTEIRGTGYVLEATTQPSSVVLLISGSYSRLWIDRVQLSRSGQAGPKPTLDNGQSGDFTLKLDASRPGEAVLGTAAGNSLRFAPRVLTNGDRQLSENGFWAIGARDKSDVAFLAALPSQGGVATLDLHAEPCAVDYIVEPGLLVKYSLRNAQAASLAVDLVFPLSENASVTVADLRGTPLTLSLAEFHGFPYSTVTEIAMESAGICVSFPRGVVVWFDREKKNQLSVTVRSANESRRGELECAIYPHCVSNARLFARLMNEASEFEQRLLNSAALARYEHIVANAPKTLPLAVTAGERVKKLKQARDDLYTEALADYSVAKDVRTLLAIEKAQRSIGKFQSQFPGDAEVSPLEKLTRELEEWRKAVQPTRPPEEAAKANLMAENFLRNAQKYNEQGHMLLALTMLENVLKDYGDTPSYKAARELYDQIRKDLLDAGKRDVIIDKELAAIDKACDDGNWDVAMEKCQELFKRFPDTPRNRDIMKRVRRIEERFG